MSKTRKTGGLLSLILLAGLGGVVWFVVNSPAVHTINELLTENRDLKTALSNLSQEDVMGMAKLVGQSESNGVTYTTIKFASANPDGSGEFTEAAEYVVPGKEVYYDSMIVQFDKDLVEDGSERAMYFWRRIYGSEQKPDEGFVMDEFSKKPERYETLFSVLPPQGEQVLWDNLWALEENPEALIQYGIRGVVGKAVYKRMLPNKVYTFRLGAGGGISVDSANDF